MILRRFCILGCRRHVPNHAPPEFGPPKGFLMRLSRTTAFQYCICSLAGLVAISPCPADTDASAPVVIQQYGDADGQQYFALAVTAPEGQVEKVNRHILVIDTSASQTGQVRESALRMVSQVLAKLSPKSEVQIFAADVSCDSLTQGFVGTASKNVNDAVHKLSMRTPLGTTNLQVALRTLATHIAVGEPTSVLYIGDGLTSANTLQQHELSQLTKQFVANRTSIHSLVIGPNADSELPAILANLTGGTVTTPDHGKALDIAARSAASLQTAPLSVQAFAVDGRSVSCVGSKTHMLRSDRHCIVLGTGTDQRLRKVNGPDRIR